MASVKVAVRVRPLSHRELHHGSAPVIKMDGQKTFLTNVKLPGNIGDSSSLGRERVKQFTFDFSYWSYSSTDKHFISQEKIYHDLGEEVVQSAFDGYNGCIFAYGQTGSGKTYTMMGSQDDQGLIPRICQKLFNDMTDGATTYRTEVSYLEIYNERVRDLLREKPSQMNLKVREHPKEGPYVQDLSKHLVVSYGEIQELIDRGNNNRTTAATNMNDHSSRSHAIFSILFTQAKFKDDLPSEVHSKINLVDLAGSERADLSGTSGERLKEGGSINKSLVTLGNVISSLADNAEKFGGSPRQNVFVPYRDSVLTWLLKDSLGGNSKTIMIATISPSESNYAETLSTLRYASRAKKIVNKPTINEDTNVRLIRELREENARLKALLENHEAGLIAKQQLDANEERMKMLTHQWADKWHQTEAVLKENKMLALRQVGHSIVLDSELPYLLEIEDNVLSTGMKLYHLQEGDTTLGSGSSEYDPDIVIESMTLEPLHCKFSHDNCEVYIKPFPGARCSINNHRIVEPTKLSQGMVIRMGRKHLFRFNHPGEAAKMRQQAQLKGAFSDPYLSVDGENQFAWGNTSMCSLTDSAVGSDWDQGESELFLSFSQHEDINALEIQRAELAEWREQQLEAEAHRLAQLAEQEANRVRLQEERTQLQQLAKSTEERLACAKKAEEEARRLSRNLEEDHQKFNLVCNHKTLQEQEEEFARRRREIEEEKERTRAERARLQRKRDEEQATLQQVHKRYEQQEEELKLERKRFHKEQEEVRKALRQQKDKLREGESYSEELFNSSARSLRELVEKEVQDMQQFVAKVTTPRTSTPSPLRDIPTSRLTDEEDSDVEVARLRLSDWTEPELGSRDVSEEQVPEKLLSPSSSQPLRKLSETSLLELMERPVNQWGEMELSDQLDLLHEEVQGVEEQVCWALQRQYSSVLTEDSAPAELDQQVTQQFEALRPHFEQLEKIVAVQAPEGRLTERLQEYDQRLTVTDIFLQIHVVIGAIKDAMSGGQFLKVIENLDALYNIMKTLDDACVIRGCDDMPEQQNCDSNPDELYQTLRGTLRTELSILREKLLYQLTETWSTLLKWSLPMPGLGGRGSLQPRTSTLEVTGLESRLELLSTTIRAMHSLGILTHRIQVFSQKVLDYLLKPLVHDRNTLLQVIDETEKYICVVINPPADSQAVGQVSQMKPPQVTEVFQKLEQVFAFLHKPLQGICLHENFYDKDMEDRTPREKIHLLELIGEHVCGPLFEYIYKHCFSQLAPRTQEQFEAVKQVIDATENFQDTLKVMKFLASGRPGLLEYFHNMSSLLASIKSQQALRSARQLLAKDLTQSLTVSPGQPLGVGAPELIVQFATNCRSKAGTVNMKLPVCRISCPVSSLMCLAYNTLKEAVGTSYDGALHLCTCVSHMFELYCESVPAAHREQFNSFPVLAALHHNNCMFVAHHLVTIDKMFRQKIQESAPSSSSVTYAASVVQSSSNNMVDVITHIRRLGNDLFTDHVNRKKEKLTDHLIMAQGFDCVADDEGEGALRAVKHFLHHLRHVCALWRDVLPTNAYYKAVGSLLNDATTDMMSSVISIEEFSADDCEHLQRIFSHVVEAAPEYFSLPSPAEAGEETPSSSSKLNPVVALHEHVSSWLRFSELTKLLGLNLQGISDRWADGKGPLGMCFTSEEVRHLVVAMFEDTPKRRSFLNLLRRNSDCAYS